MRKWIVLSLIAATILIGDQVTKYLAVEHLTAAFQVARAQTTGEKISAFISERDVLERGLTTRPIDVFRSWFQLRYTQNRGAAFSFLAGMHGEWRTLFFHFITLCALIFIFSTYRKLKDDQRWMQISLALLLGGALGNGIDRAIRGYVIDFIVWHINDPDFTGSQWRHWPTFNVADCGVSVGLTMLILAMLFQKQPEGNAKSASASKDSKTTTPAAREATAAPRR